MKLKLVGSDSKVLRKQCKKIQKITAKTKQLAGDMFSVMRSNDGIGLAAPQVGRDICLITVNTTGVYKDGIKRTLINPEILGERLEKEIDTEGCLSFKDQFYKVERHKEIIVTYKDLEGNIKFETFEGLNARVVQHEIDHLNGILFIDKKIT